MEEAKKIVSFLALIFLLLTIVFNLVPRLPKIPGDIYLEKQGFNLYIPWLSALIISVILTVVFNFFR